MPSGAASASPVAQPLVGVFVMQPVASAGCVNAPVEVLRVKAAIALPLNAPTYTFFPSGVTVTTSAPSSARPLAHPVVGVPAIQPLPSSACVSAPVELSRLKVATESLDTEVAYTFSPSALTATELG